MDWNVVLITAKMDSIAGSVGVLLPEIWRSWAEPRNHMQASMIFDYQSTKQKDTSPTRCKTTPQADFLPYFFGFAPETSLCLKQSCTQFLFILILIVKARVIRINC